MKQIELIDRYIDALNQNPKALPPDDLDPQTANFVRTLWMLEHPQRKTPNVEAAIWQKALRDAERINRNGGMSSSPPSRNSIEEAPITFNQMVDELHEEKKMFPAESLGKYVRPRPSTAYRISSLIAALLLFSFGSLLMLVIIRFRASYPYAVLLQATQTPIPLEKIAPSNIDRLTQLYTTTLDSQDFTAVAFSPDGHYLAYGNGKNTVDLWNVQTKKVEKKLTNPYFSAFRLAFSGTSHLLAVTGEKGGAIWDITTDNDPLVLAYDPDVLGTGALTFSNDGQALLNLVCTRANEVGCLRDEEYAWDVVTGKRIIAIQRAAGAGGDSGISPTADLAAFGYDDGRLLTRVFSTGSDLDVLQYEGAHITAVNFSLDGTLLAVADREHTVQIWDVTTKTVVFKEIQPDKSHDIALLIFNADNTLLASSGIFNDKKIQFWDIKGKKALTSFEATEQKDNSFISWMAFSPDGKLFVSHSNDGKIRVWGVIAGS